MGTDGPTVGRSDLIARGAIAVSLSTVANWLLLWVVLATDAVEPFDPLSFPPVTLLTVAGAVGATLVYGALKRWVEQPDRTFIRIAAIVLLLSFVPDIALLELDADATVPAVIILMAMHIVVAAICVAILTDAVGVFDRRSRT